MIIQIKQRKSVGNLCKMTELNDLFDNCLIKVFDYCQIDTLVAVAQTCKRFKQIAERYNFPKFTQYECLVYSPSVDKEIIKFTGKHLRKLAVTFSERTVMSPVNRDEYCEFLVQNVGSNIRELKIECDGIRIPPIELLAPILRQLEGLELLFQSYAEQGDFDYVGLMPNKKTYLVDLAALCPNLQRLIYNGLNKFPPNFGTFNKLQSLTVSTCYRYQWEIQNFLEKNVQITQVRFHHYTGADQYIVFNNLTRNLNGLENLHIAVPLITDWSPQLLEFHRLQKLKILRLEYVRENVNDLLVNSTNLKHLTSLSVYGCYKYEISGPETICQQQTLVQIAKKLLNLETFHVSLPSTKEVSWDRQTVIDFVRFATKLQAVHFQKLNFECTSAFTRDLVKARNTANPNAEPLEMGAGGAQFHSTIDHLESFRYGSVTDFFTTEQEPDVQRYLKNITVAKLL